MKRLTANLLMLVMVLCVYAADPGWVSAQVSDDFEDGMLGSGEWVTGGRRISYTPTDQGDWNWSCSEIDGYPQMHLMGPASANSYGAAAWMRGTYNFNDGHYYTQNFSWNVEVPERAFFLLVQITDGDNIPTFEESHWTNDWLFQDYPGTYNLLPSWDGESFPPGVTDHLGTSPVETWSITIDPAGIASLYRGPDGTGSLVLEKGLDPNEEWHTRFVVWSATSSGYPAGDGRFNLYSYSVVPEPSAVVLLGIGGAGLFVRGWRRRGGRYGISRKSQ